MLKNSDMIYDLKYIPTISNRKNIKKKKKSKEKDYGNAEDIIENI